MTAASSAGSEAGCRHQRSLSLSLLFGTLLSCNESGIPGGVLFEGQGWVLSLAWDWEHAYVMSVWPHCPVQCRQACDEERAKKKGFSICATGLTTSFEWSEGGHDVGAENARKVEEENAKTRIFAESSHSPPPPLAHFLRELDARRRTPRFSEDFVSKKGAMRKMKICGPNFHQFFRDLHISHPSDPMNMLLRVMWRRFSIFVSYFWSASSKRVVQLLQK